MVSTVSDGGLVAVASSTARSVADSGLVAVAGYVARSVAGSVVLLNIDSISQLTLNIKV